MKNIGIIGSGSLAKNLSKLICINEWTDFLIMSDISPIIPDIHNIKHPISNNKENIQMSDIIFLAVHPNQIKSICEDINNYSIGWSKDKIIISTAIGVSVNKIKRWIDKDYHIVRCIPNIYDKNGTIVWYSEDLYPYDEDREIIDIITKGTNSIWLKDENLIDFAAISFNIIPSHIKFLYDNYLNTAEKLGFDKKDTSLLLKSINETNLELINHDKYKEEIPIKYINEKINENFDMLNDVITNSVLSSIQRVKEITKSLD